MKMITKYSLHKILIKTTWLIIATPGNLHHFFSIQKSRLVHVLYSYTRQRCSKTSNNGPSEKRTISVQRTDHLPPIDFTNDLLIHFEPPRSAWTPLISEQRTLSLMTPTNSFVRNANACRLLRKIVGHHRWIQRPSIIY